jgi:putative membrane protein insertion efficiency factor
MNKIMIRLIDGYKKTTSNTNPTCRYHPTCSSYAKVAYQKHNFFYASLLSVWRILRCNPLSKGGYDPVPKTRKEKEESDELHEHQTPSE